VLLPKLDELIAKLRAMAHAHAALPMLSRTHGQTASPTTVGKEIANVVARLDRQRDVLAGPAHAGQDQWRGRQLQRARRRLSGSRLGGAVAALRRRPGPGLAALHHADRTARRHRRTVRRVQAHRYDRHRSLPRHLGLHLAGLLQAGGEGGEVGSSTMPHKVNPIDFENAEGNFGIANALFEHFAAKLPISRWQRDLTDSTVLRALGTAFGHALIGFDALQRGLGKLSVNPERLAADLDAAGKCWPKPCRR
jgi:adenylosuccinate lyase